MAAYLFHRLTGALLVIFGVTGIVFLLVHLIPGDPVEIMLGESASVADREVLRAALGLDKPVLTQFYNYLGGLLQLDLGTSIHYPSCYWSGSRRPVCWQLPPSRSAWRWPFRWA